MPRIEEDTNTVEVVNISSEIVKIEIDKVKHKLNPKERLTVHKNYATPRLMQQGRDPVPSSIELMTNGKVLPVTDKRVKAMLGL